jgi:DNA-binding CsgD family transcriptional regulator
MLTAERPSLVPQEHDFRLPSAAHRVRAHRDVPGPATPRREATPLLSQLEMVLDRLSEGTVVIDAAAQVLHANRRARELLALVRDMEEPSGLLSFADPRTRRAFQRALGRHEDDGDGDGDGDALARGFLVRDRAGTTVARAWLQSLQRHGADHDLPPRFLVSLHRLPQHAQVSAETLQHLYGLTPSEARVAAHVVAATSVHELAAQLALSRNTVKTHLRRAFRKCEVNSLAQLTALVATGPRLR